MLKAARRFRPYLILSALLVAAVLLLSFHPSLHRLAGLIVPSPIAEGVAYLRRGLVGSWTHYVDLGGVAQENLELRATVAELENRLGSVKELERQNQECQALLGFVAHSENRMVTALTIGRDATNWWRSVVVNRGLSDGVQVDTPVILPIGVVGRVTRAWAGASRVQLLTDPACAVSCLVKPSRATGIAVGTGRPDLVLKYVDQTEVVNLGDAVFTSGLDGIFPRGQLVGYVSEISIEEGDLFQKIVVVPVVDFGKLEEVLLVTEFERLPEGEEDTW
jgi:rod shape-determining protein MreC